MANTFYSGSVTIDSTGVGKTGAAKVAYIVFTPDATTDSVLLYDSATTTANLKITFKGGTAKSTVYLDFSAKPLTFSNGIYAVVSSAGTATLILTSEGSSV